jgi:signal transduction histidine kinase
MSKSSRKPLLPLDALEHERRSLAEELHEGLCQNLCGISIHLKVLQRRLEKEAPPFATGFQELQDTLEATIDQMRFLYRTLKPPISDAATLIEAINELAASKKADFKCDSTFQDCGARLGPVQAVAFFRIAQAALRDSFWNPAVTKTHICLAIENDSAIMTVAETREPGAANRHQYAVELMAAEATASGGHFEVQANAPTDGFFRFRLPLI